MTQNGSGCERGTERRRWGVVGGADQRGWVDALCCEKKIIVRIREGEGGFKKHEIRRGVEFKAVGK